MQKKFLQFIRDHQLFQEGETVLLAVSGGVDSMVMLDLFIRSGYRVSVAHANFQLRGNSSDGDEEFVKDVCSKHGVPFYSRRFETNNYANRQKLSVQMAARELRYQWFDELISLGEGSRLATAHHVNDSVETVLMNLIHGTGIHGLTGIPVINGYIIRPIAFSSRAEILEYARAYQVTWREDVSNLSDDYQRNFLRHQVVPLLQQVNPALEDAVRRTMMLSAGEQEILQMALQSWKESFMVLSPDRVRIQKEGLRSFQRKEALLVHLLDPYGFNFSTCQDIVQSLDHQSGKQFFSPTHHLVIDREELVIGVLSESNMEVLITAEQGQARWGSFQMHLHRSREVRFSADPSRCFLDTTHISYPLTWRKWKEGDYFFPLGMNNRKKVSDFLIDAKFSRLDKEQVTVLQSGDDIICLPGLRTDNRFKITERTKEVLEIILEEPGIQ